MLYIYWKHFVVKTSPTHANNRYNESGRNELQSISSTLRLKSSTLKKGCLSLRGHANQHHFEHFEHAKSKYNICEGLLWDFWYNSHYSSMFFLETIYGNFLFIDLFINYCLKNFSLLKGVSTNMLHLGLIRIPHSPPL